MGTGLGNPDREAPEHLFVGPGSCPDRYRLLHAVGVGGEGEVWAAEERLTENATVPVAVKMLRLVCPESSDRARLRWENQLARVRHLHRPGIARVLESFVGPAPHGPGRARPDGDVFYVILEWVPGPTLQSWVLDQPDTAAGFEVAVEALLPVAQALDYMHGGEDTGQLAVVHGDVKPANIIMSPGGGTLVDFGLVRWVDGAPPSVLGGTPGYLAPEVLDGGVYSPASDRFSFGGVVYFAITGRHPPATHDLTRIRAAVTESWFGDRHPGLLDHLVSAMAADPAERPATATGWLSAFGAATGAALVGTPRPSARRPSRPARLGVLAALASLSAAAVLFFGVLGREGSSPPEVAQASPGNQSSPDLVLEAENGQGDGNVMPRSGASNARTVWLHDGEKVRMALAVGTGGTYRLAVTYSNDNDDALPSEELAIEVDAGRHATFVPEDTGSGGAGWNTFRTNVVGDIRLAPGQHEVVVGVTGGDGYGVEIDRIRLSLA